MDHGSETTYVEAVKRVMNTHMAGHSLARTDQPNAFRLRPSLLKMIQSECRAERTDFSEFMRYATIAAMERGRYQAVSE
jgi:hypothetical protein